MKSALLPNWPTKKEILGVVPEHCMVKDTAKSMMYAVISTALTVGCGLAAYAWLPLQAAWSPVWLAYVPLRLALHRLYHCVSYRLVHRVSHKASPCLRSLRPLPRPRSSIHQLPFLGDA
jgi:hypothetical protein